MAKRKIIRIDRDKCDGCGICTGACAEGALVLDDENKAALAKEMYCDGMGACLDVCPKGALKIVERECVPYDPGETYRYVLDTRGEEAAAHVHGIPKGKAGQERHYLGTGGAADRSFSHGCPGSVAQEIEKFGPLQDSEALSGESELRQWPIQLHLISPLAPYFNQSDLLVAADCTAFALGGFHKELLKGKKLIIACPKLDNTGPYIEKMADIFRNHNINSLTVATMVVPCCSGLNHIVERAVEMSGTSMRVKKIAIGIDGDVRK
jgi:NAD-dependent dihydropyrimidine dehydrogenase PreA subunit